MTSMVVIPSIAENFNYQRENSAFLAKFTKAKFRWHNNLLRKKS